MKGRKILILGAGIYQVPLIKKAREMGLETLVASIPGQYPGFREADRSFFVDTRDASAVLRIAEEERIDGIVTTGTDVAVHTIGAVCDAMNLPGISRRAAEIVTDKALMKRAFRGKVTSSPFAEVHSLGEAFEAASEIGYPVMMKACDVSGSRGVTKVVRPEDLESAYLEAEEASQTDHFVVEAFVDGHEIGLDAFVSGGKIRYAEPHQKFVVRAGGVTIPGGHSFPMKMSGRLKENILRETKAIVDAAGLDHCAMNADLFVLPDESVSVIEAGGRCGATCIPELITLHTGIDYYKEMLLASIGEPTDFTVRASRPAVAKLLFSDADGTVEAIDEDRIDAVRSKGFDVAIDIRPGDEVRCPRNGTDRIGHVIGADKSEAEVDAALAEVLKALTIRSA